MSIPTKKMFDFIQRWSFTASLFKLWRVDLEVEKNLRVGGKVNFTVYTTLPTDAVYGDEIWYDDGGTIKKLFFDAADDWRTIATLGAIVT